MRVLMVSIVLAAVGLAVWFWFKSAARPLVSTTGNELAVIDSRVGPYQPLGGRSQGSMNRLLRWLPRPILRALSLTGGSGSSRNQGRYTYADLSNCFMVTFRWEKQGVPQSPQSLRNRLFLVDERGWLYDNVAWSSAGSGHYAEDELNRYGFSSFPRWQRTLDLVLLEPDAKGPPPRLTLSNPAFRERPLTNWPAPFLPQVLESPNVQFRLEGLRPEGVAIFSRRIQSTALRSPRRWSPEIQSRDADGTSNAWHVVRHSYYDNYGNHSLHGFPHRVAGDSPGARQWRLEVTMAADDRSTVASNRFWELPAHSMPGLGTAHTWSGTNRHWPDLELRFGAFAGPGTLVYTNGYLSEVDRSSPAPAGRGRSSSTSMQGTNRLERIKATMPSAHVAFSPYGPGTTNYHYSCRLIDAISGDSHWLGSYRSASGQPEFMRFYPNNERPLIFSCESLETNRAYRIILGVHPVRSLDFFVAEPELPEL